MEMNLTALEKLSNQALHEYINDCIQNNFSALVQLLYRIDVSEQKLKKVLQESPNEDAAKLITQLILDRLEATKKARAEFAKPTPPNNVAIDNEEKL